MQAKILNLTASAGVAPNKFLAKIASDWKKPDGLFVIQPHQIHDFLRNLPIGRIPGVGKVTEQHLLDAEIKTVGDVQAMDAETLEARFGRYGLRLYELARGIDHSPVVPNRVRKSISAEDTFPEDIPLPETESASISREGLGGIARERAGSAHGRAQVEDERIQHADPQSYTSGDAWKCGELGCCHAVALR
jgi:nucleotidyltransferase/DNA polymerase involved in DNA repair